MDSMTIIPGEQEAPALRLSLKLFIVGGRPESAPTILRLRKILRDHNLQSSAVQIVDIQKEPQLAKEAQVVGTPTLVKESPLPKKAVVGDLSDADVVLEALGLPVTKGQYVAGLIDRPQEPSVLPETGRADLKTIRVMLINFSTVVSSGIRAMLAEEKSIELTADAMDPEQALSQLKNASEQGLPCHVALIKMRPGAFDGVAATRLIKKQFPEVSVILIAEQEDHSNVIDAILAGVGGYMFLKDVSLRNLSESIHWVVEGGTRMNTALLRNAMEGFASKWRYRAQRAAEAANLTDREVDVLRLMGNGDNNIGISQSLGISLDTTKKHVHNIINKLQARSRTHAAIIAVQAGIVGNAHIVVNPRIR